MSSFLLLILQLLVLFQVVFADKARDIAIELDKALNEPESLEALKSLVVLPFYAESCKVSLNYEADQLNDLVENQYKNLQTESGKAAVKTRLVTNAKFEGDDEKIVSFNVAYADGEILKYKARQLEGGKFVFFDERVVNCNPS